MCFQPGAGRVAGARTTCIVFTFTPNPITVQGNYEYKYLSGRGPAASCAGSSRSSASAPRTAGSAASLFLLLLAEFALVGLTSSLTLSIFGILKELATIALSALLLGDALNASNLAGFAICIGGAALYNYSTRGGAHSGARE